MSTVITRALPVRRLTASATGAALEAYEWSLYTLLVTYFAPHFFGGSLQHSVVYGLGVFAVGFVIRPIGALALGRLADRRGRRPALLASISIAGLATLGMALTPGRESIGAAAPVLLLVWRLLLGFSFGGEQAIAQAYMYESAPPRRRMLGTSVYSIFYGLGTVCANLVVAVLVGGAGSAAVSSGYWRVPFLLAAALSLVFLLARRGLPETLERGASPESESPESDGVHREWRRLLRPMLAVAGLTAGCLSSYYLWISAPTSYALSVLKMPDTQVLWAGVTSQLAFMTVAPLYGWLADRYGVLRWMAWCSLALAVATLPMRLLMNSATVTTYWVLMIVAAASVATLSATLTGASAAVAPHRHRVTVMALPYSIATAIFGGTTPALQEWSAPHPLLFSLYIAILLVITATTALLARPLVRPEPAPELTA